MERRLDFISVRCLIGDEVKQIYINKSQVVLTYQQDNDVCIQLDNGTDVIVTDTNLQVFMDRFV
jgi:hypothetical protein